MCHSQDLNNKLNRLHKRFLRLIFNDKRSTFRKLLDKDHQHTSEILAIDQHTSEILAIEIY